MAARENISPPSIDVDSQLHKGLPSSTNSSPPSIESDSQLHTCLPSSTNPPTPTFQQVVPNRSLQVDSQVTKAHTSARVQFDNPNPWKTPSPATK